MPKAQSLKKWDDHKRRYLESLAARTGVRLELENRTGSRWARGAGRAVAVLGSDEAGHGNRWWFGLREKEFRDRHAVGVILLCGTQGRVVDLGLAATKVSEFLSDLSLEPHRGERKLNVFRRGERYFLQVPGGQPVELTEARGDVSWLGPGSAAESTDNAVGIEDPNAPLAGNESGTAFFARVRKGALEPLDSADLSDGEIVLVTVTRTDAVPATAAFRRIVARGGPASLPRDLAEQHDHYAHGAPRR